MGKKARARQTIALAREALPKDGAPSSEAGEVAAELAAMETEMSSRPTATARPRPRPPVSASGAYGPAQSWDRE